MNRRELLRLVALATGGVVIGGEFLLSGCNNPSAGSSMTFTESDIALLDEVAETIFPKTNTPGAKEAKVGEYMTVMVNDCYDEADKKTFHEGMDKLNAACKEMHHTTFMNSNAKERTDLLTVLDKEAKEYNKTKNDFDKAQNEKEKAEFAKGNKSFVKEKMPSHYFTMMKQLTITGYFTSKVGRIGATRYEPVPGKFIGDLDYKKGDKIFTNLM